MIGDLYDMHTNLRAFHVIILLGEQFIHVQTHRTIKPVRLQNWVNGLLIVYYAHLPTPPPPLSTTRLKPKPILPETVSSTPHQKRQDSLILFLQNLRACSAILETSTSFPLTPLETLQLMCLMQFEFEFNLFSSSTLTQSMLRSSLRPSSRFSTSFIESSSSSSQHKLLVDDDVAPLCIVVPITVAVSSSTILISNT
ncbi:hypothetical protein VNO78_13679 [Psophocarpus tetragonolobus]|uniref:Uncharacterized protein n=1 Tax=Psophocarpus tetragonolobus TaxID=3891 RepID=A0AAN9SXU7_PSOTE